MNPAEMSAYLDEVSDYLRGLFGDEQYKYLINIFISDEVARIEVADSLEDDMRLAASVSFNDADIDPKKAAKELYDAVMSRPFDIKKKVMDLFSMGYEDVKDKIIVKLVPENDKYLNRCESIKAADGLLLVPYFSIDDENGGAVHIIIPKGTSERYGLLKEKIILDGVVNTSRLYPATIFSLDVLIENIFAALNVNESFDSALHKLDVDAIGASGVCLSTKNHVNGAVACVYSGVLKKIADHFSSDLYLVFTSLHEVMVHSVRECQKVGMDSEALKQIVKETMDEATDIKDRLTENIYIYRRDEGVIEKV